jgi:hypothetical protein
VTSHQGIAAVTRAIAYFAGALVRSAVPEATVTLDRPEQPPAGSRDDPRLNLYLVQVAPDPTLRSQDLPTRGAGGELVAVPQVGLDLRYLFSYFGPSPKAQLMLGAIELALHEQPVLSPALIEHAFAGDPELLACGLQTQSPPVRITPSTVSLEDLSRFWSGFFQMPYTLSTMYQAGPLILSSALTPGAYGPVQHVGLAAAGMPPTLAALGTVTYAPATPVAVRGRGVRAGQWARVGGHWAPIEPGVDSALAFALPTAVAAGTVEVLLGELPSDGGTPQPISGTPERTLVVRPVLERVATVGEDERVTITLAPPLQPGQHVEVSLLAMALSGEGTPPSATLSIVAGSHSRTLTLPLPPGLLSAGLYLAIVAVDGVSSLPIVEDGHAIRPTVLLG